MLWPVVISRYPVGKIAKKQSEGVRFLLIRLINSIQNTLLQTIFARPLGRKGFFLCIIV